MLGISQLASVEPNPGAKRGVYADDREGIGRNRIDIGDTVESPKMAEYRKVFVATLEKIWDL